MNQATISSPIQDFIENLLRKYAGLNEGEVATYIPELAKADPALFGICLVTADGQIYEAGDSQHEFTIQSISKPFVYGMALEDHTRTDVLTKIGMEPTGEAFNAISLETGTGRPRNPMINAGAIAAAGLIGGKSSAGKLRRILDTFSLYAGRDLTVDEEVYKSESVTGHRNRAIGHMLRNFDILQDDPIPIVDLYFKQCSISVTCRDLAIMGATLANHGVNPVTAKRAIRGEYVESVLSVMASCGMYDYAGEWIYRVGIPAKSGVAGGIVAVLPGQLGIGIYSPPLDPRGNSVRGIKVCDDLSRQFDLHLFNRLQNSRSVIRLVFSGAEVNSSKVRVPADVQFLRRSGAAIKLYELQGNLVFSTVEVVVRDIIARVEGCRFIILDLKRTLEVNESACRLFLQLLVKLDSIGVTLLFTYSSIAPQLRRYLKGALRADADRLLHLYDDNDLALEYCEDVILAESCERISLEKSLPVSDYELFAGLDEVQLGIVTGFLQRQSYRKGSVIVNTGDEARELFIVCKGQVSANVTLASGLQKRLATFTQGMAFGEMALIDKAPRSAVVSADTDVDCDVLPIEWYEQLGQSHPQIKLRILENLAHSLSLKLRKANREASVFDY